MAVFASVFPLKIVESVGLSSNTVISVDLWLDVAHHPQEVVQYSFPVLLVTALDATHFVQGLFVHLNSRVAMRTQCL